MNISPKLNKRFCTDYQIMISIFDEPYFSERLALFDRYMNGTISKYNTFIGLVNKYGSEDRYLEHYNLVKDNAISSIKGTNAFQRFISEDMNKFRVQYKDIPSKDIYKPSFDGRKFISIDMRKANFSALRYYDKGIFNGVDTWEEFISQFTDSEHIINSKYVRQVILGNCCCNRHISYEKYLMSKVLDVIFELDMFTDKIVFFSNDEIVLDVTDCALENIDLESLKSGVDKIGVLFKWQVFTLHKIHGTRGYYKHIMNSDFSYDIDFKCITSIEYPLVLRKYLGEEIQESDKVFYHEGMLAKLIDVPDISF